MKKGWFKAIDICYKCGHKQARWYPPIVKRKKSYDTLCAKCDKDNPIKLALKILNKHLMEG